MSDLIVSQKVDDFMRTTTAAQMRAVLEAIQLNGALGTPTSGVATNLTGTAAGLTAGTASAVAVGGITGLGTGVAAALAVANGAAGGYATINGAAALTNKTYNGLTVTTTTGTLTLAAAKVLTVSNTLTFTGTDGSSVAFGTGGTVLYSGGAGFVSSIAGTANQITASAATGAVTLSIPSTFVAPGSIAATTTLLVGNGTAGTALSALTVYDTGTSLPRGISNVQVSASADSANFSAYKARGTIGSEAAVTNSDILGNFRAWGYSGAGGYVNTGSLMFRVPATGTVATTRVPGEAVISVGTDAAPSVLTETAKFSSMTGIALTALGTNQSITLTPSGTGKVVVGIAGLAATPSLVWAGQLTSGFFSAGSNRIGVSLGGTQYWEYNGSTLTGAAGAVLSMVGQLTMTSTNIVRFGATSNITLGATADTTAGDLTLTTSSTGRFVLAGTGILVKPGGTVPLITTNTAITSGAGVGVGTLTNAPASTNPTAWVPINDSGTTRYIPAW